MVYIGIDLGGTSIKAGIVDEEGKILHRGECPTKFERGHEAVVTDMANLALQICKEAGISLDDVKAIGCGVPGIAIAETGVVPFCTNLGWHNVPLRQLMQQVIDKPIFIDNDATVAGLAEAVAGVSAGIANSVFLTLGTGVGGGIIIDGKVFSGTHNVGSELGHMIVVVDGDQCTCGNKGCWERYASATALINAGKAAANKNNESTLYTSVNGNLDAITAKTVVDASKAGDADAIKVFNNYVHYLAMGIITIINFIDPEVIVLGGGVSKAGNYLLDAVVKDVSKDRFYKSLPFSRIELAVLGNDAGIIGAAMLGK